MRQSRANALPSQQKSTKGVGRPPSKGFLSLSQGTSFEWTLKSSTGAHATIETDVCACSSYDMSIRFDTAASTGIAPCQPCLSYRTRNNKGPLRQYTDLSARTLACHLVEEYCQAGKDPSQGLCQSTPILPWYEGARTYNLRRHCKKTPKQQSEEVVIGYVLEDAKHGSSTTKQTVPPSDSASAGARQSPKRDEQDVVSQQSQLQHGCADNLKTQLHASSVGMSAMVPCPSKAMVKTSRIR